MTTLSAIAARAEKRLTHTGLSNWTDAALQEWVIEAIREYSQHFPRLTSTTITITGDEGACPPGHTVDLPVDLLGIVLVEYPVGEDPPEYLKRLARAHTDFYDVEGFYDLQPALDPTGNPVLHLSESATEAEQITVVYTCPHDTDLEAGDSITVPVHHEPLLVLCVAATAAREILGNEIQSPDATDYLISQLRRVAEKLSDDYQVALARAKREASGEGRITGPWKMDTFDRIY